MKGTTLPDILDLDALGVVPLEVVEGALQPRQRVEELLDGHRRRTLIQTADLLQKPVINGEEGTPIYDVQTEEGGAQEVPFMYFLTNNTGEGQ